MELSNLLYIIAMALFALIIAAIVVLTPLAIYALRHDSSLHLPNAMRLEPKITFRSIRNKFKFRNRQQSFPTENSPVEKIHSQRKGNRHK